MAAPIDKLFLEICNKFGIVLTLKQKQAITGLFNFKDVFVGTKTGSGKSMTYECAPILFDNGTTLIIAPLTSIMKEQVDRLKGLGYKAIHIGTEEDDIHGIRNGHYHFVFGSPELLVGNEMWRDVIKSSSFQNNHRLTVVDEAHTVVQWGHGSAQESPFREWFAHIGELRSLSLNVPVLALTATASPTNRKKIMKSLCFKKDSIVILDNPDRQNIKITVITIPNNEDDEKLFHWLIKGTHGEYRAREHVP
ncbi:ATP-dependent DNA helicase RecQ-like [Saccostrea echinata]|uniref:ATP-dependent DNA helicase RecQ-like n=1 Tax=Saccostrea echinata TaxID=191078 RepID=UPI002A83C518|nr:ATP-dependent DNA helicase RecQ-like [Saccostrea echinata]